MNGRVIPAGAKLKNSLTAALCLESPGNNMGLDTFDFCGEIPRGSLEGWAIRGDDEEQFADDSAGEC